MGEQEEGENWNRGGIGTWGELEYGVNWTWGELKHGGIGTWGEFKLGENWNKDTSKGQNGEA